SSVGNESLVDVLRDTHQRSAALRDVLSRSFGDRLPRDFNLEPLMALAASPQSYHLLSDLFALLSRKGCPCSSQLLAGWGSMASSTRLLASLEQLIDLIAPKTDEDWGQLYALLHACWGRPEFERIFQL